MDLQRPLRTFFQNMDNQFFVLMGPDCGPTMEACVYISSDWGLSLKGPLCRPNSGSRPWNLDSEP